MGLLLLLLLLLPLWRALVRGVRKSPVWFSVIDSCFLNSLVDIVRPKHVWFVSIRRLNDNRNSAENFPRRSNCAAPNRRAFELLQEHMVAVMTEPPAIDEAQRGGTGNGKQHKKGKGTKNKNTLPKACEGLPNPAIKALGKGMGLAGWRGIAPGFYVRYMLNDYVKELGRKDEVLRRQPLESLSDFDLREACNARAIDVADDGRGRDMTALRNSLAEWLELTSSGGVANREAGPNVVFLPDRARLLGLGLNFLENARTGQCGELQRRAMLSRW